MVATALCVWVGGGQSAFAQSAEAAGIEPTAPDLHPVERQLLIAGALLSLVPGALGIDVGTGDAPRGVIEWPLQVPLATMPTHSRTAALTNHRIVVSAALRIGPTHRTVAPPADAQTAWVTFIARAGYRFVWHPHGRDFGILVGLGTTLETWPLVRPSVSPEIGFHVGACCGEATEIMTIVVRGDAWFWGDSTLRASVLIGWAFY